MRTGCDGKGMQQVLMHMLICTDGGHVPCSDTQHGHTVIGPLLV